MFAPHALPAGTEVGAVHDVCADEAGGSGEPELCERCFPRASRHHATWDADDVVAVSRDAQGRRTIHRPPAAGGAGGGSGDEDGRGITHPMLAMPSLDRPPCPPPPEANRTSVEARAAEYAWMRWIVQYETRDEFCERRRLTLASQKDRQRRARSLPDVRASMTLYRARLRQVLAPVSEGGDVRMRKLAHELQGKWVSVYNISGRARTPQELMLPNPYRVARSSSASALRRPVREIEAAAEQLTARDSDVLRGVFPDFDLAAATEQRLIVMEVDAFKAHLVRTWLRVLWEELESLGVVPLGIVSAHGSAVTKRSSSGGRARSGSGGRARSGSGGRARSGSGGRARSDRRGGKTGARGGGGSEGRSPSSGVGAKVFDTPLEDERLRVFVGRELPIQKDRVHPLAFLKGDEKAPRRVRRPVLGVDASSGARQSRKRGRPTATRDESLSPSISTPSISDESSPPPAPRRRHERKSRRRSLSPGSRMRTEHVARTLQKAVVSDAVASDARDHEVREALRARLQNESEVLHAAKFAMSRMGGGARADSGRTDTVTSERRAVTRRSGKAPSSGARVGVYRGNPRASVASSEVLTEDEDDDATPARAPRVSSLRSGHTASLHTV